MQYLQYQAQYNADIICQSVTSYDTIREVETSSYTLQVEKIPVTSSIYAKTYSTKSFGGQYQVVPVRDLLLLTNSTNTNTTVSNICI